MCHMKNTHVVWHFQWHSYRLGQWPVHCHGWPFVVCGGDLRSAVARGRKKAKGPTHRLLYFMSLMMHYVHVCLVFHWTYLRFEIKTCYGRCAIEDHLTFAHFRILQFPTTINPLNPELNPICYLLALLGAHHFLHVSWIRVKLLNFRLLMSYIYGAPILDVSRSHTTTQHSR